MSRDEIIKLLDVMIESKVQVNGKVYYGATETLKVIEAIKTLVN